MRMIMVTIVLSWACPSFAQKVGDTVVVIADKRAELRRNEVIGTAPRGRRLRVDEVNGEWLWVNSQGTRGWINRSDVIHIDKAIDFFTAAIDRNPTAGDYNRRGMIWRAKGNDDNAIRDYNEAIRLDRRLAGVYNNRANVWLRKREYAKAIKDYNEAIQLDPKDTWAYRNRGILWYRRRNYTKAISDFDKAIRWNAKYASNYHYRGKSWYYMGQYEKAIRDFNEAIRFDPTHRWAYYYLGDAWYRKGDYGNALREYNATIRIKPDFAEAYNAIAWMQATCPIDRYRDGAEAVANGRRACELTKWKDHRYLDTLAAAYAANRSFPEAVKWQQKAIESASARYKDQYRSRLSLYESDTPYRENPK